MAYATIGPSALAADRAFELRMELSNQLWIGLGGSETRERQVFPFRVSQIRNPVNKIMLVEEDRATIDDSRWAPRGEGPPNLVSPRHRGRGDVGFADGHLEAVTPTFGQNLTNSNPTL
jgi:prepilin-type processing-associated H-X9-DG protein